MISLLELLKTLHAEFQQKLESLNNALVSRDVVLADMEGKASVAIGMRRTGKTYCLFEEIKRLLGRKIPLTQILHIDFEDDRLQPISQAKLAGLLDQFYSLYPENHEKRCYFFLDEIQVVDDWPLVIRRYLNTKDVKIYLTSSSAKMLSKEIATSMRGRSLSVEVWPYSFYEYLKAAGKDQPKKILSQQKKDMYAKLLEEYLMSGGFPEVVNKPKIKWMQLLQDYVSIVTYRDIVERHKIRDTALIKYVIGHLLKNASTPFSVNKFYKDVKSQGISVSRATLYEYLSYIEDGYLSFSVPLYSDSLRKTQNNPRKIYSIDTGMTLAHQLGLTPSLGHLFENLIYLDLRRQGHDIYYYLTEERYEVDFLTRGLDGSLNLYQVTWDVSDEETAIREKRALQKAEEELGIKGHIITRQNYFEWLAEKASHQLTQ